MIIRNLLHSWMFGDEDVAGRNAIVLGNRLDAFMLKDALIGKVVTIKKVVKSRGVYFVYCVCDEVPIHDQVLLSMELALI